MSPRTTSKTKTKITRVSAAAKSGVTPLSPKELSRLNALPDEYAEAPNESVAFVLEESRDLRSASRVRAKALLAESKLKPGFLERLDASRTTLDRAESIWSAARTRLDTRALREARKAAESLKKQAMVALRYFASANEDVQARLDKIAEGTGDLDTVDDLRKLGVLAKEQAPALKKAKSLPRALPAELARRADTLDAEVEAKSQIDGYVAEEAAAAITMRNRAFWALCEEMDEIREAGRYVFAKDRRALKLFRSTSTRKRRGKKASVTTSPRGKDVATPG